MNKAILLAAATMVAGLAGLPAAAQGDDMSPARLQQLDQKAADMKLPINHVKAMDIAKGKGVITVGEIKLTKRGNWKLEGADAQGHKIEIRIDGKSGKVEKLERE